jgi:hypothetical protein
MSYVNLYMFITPTLPCFGTDGVAQASPVPAVL